MTRKLLSLLSLLGLVLVIGCGSPEEKANKLFVEAANFLKMAKEAEKTSFSEALKNYEKALGNLQKIPSKYPSSQMATRMVQEDEFKIGAITFKQLKEEILPEAKLKAEAENDPFACAIMVARSTEEDCKSGIYTEIALTYAEAGQYDRIFQMIDEIEDVNCRNDVLRNNDVFLPTGHVWQFLQIAKRFSIFEADNKDVVLIEKIIKYTERGEYGKAVQLAKKRKDAMGSIYLLFLIADRCIEAGQKDKAQEILSQAFQAVKPLIDSRDDYVSMILIETADRFIRIGQEKEAVKILSQAL